MLVQVVAGTHRLLVIFNLSTAEPLLLQFDVETQASQDSDAQQSLLSALLPRTPYNEQAPAHKTTFDHTERKLSWFGLSPHS